VCVRSRTISGGDIWVFVNFMLISGVQGICAFFSFKGGGGTPVSCVQWRTICGLGGGGRGGGGHALGGVLGICRQNMFHNFPSTLRSPPEYTHAHTKYVHAHTRTHAHTGRTSFTS
jgi:hypothetical protein